jgi:hypothetical protein
MAEVGRLVEAQDMPATVMTGHMILADCHLVILGMNIALDDVMTIGHRDLRHPAAIGVEMSIGPVTGRPRGTIDGIGDDRDHLTGETGDIEVPVLEHAVDKTAIQISQSRGGHLGMCQMYKSLSLTT